MEEVKVSKPQYSIMSSTQDFNLFMAGVGSGKSHCAGYISMEFIVNFPHVRGFIGANTYGQLSKSTLDRIFNVWENFYGIYNGVHFVVDKQPPVNFETFGAKLKSYEGTISFKNGAMIFLASLDNYKVIDGTEFSWALLDETKDTKEEAVKEVIVARLRQNGIYVNNGVLSTKKKNGSKGYNPLYVFTSPAKVPWLNEWFEIEDKYIEISKKIFSKKDYFEADIGTKRVVISSTYHNQHNLPDGYIERLIESYKGNPSLIDMLVYGSPIAKTGGEFYNAFDKLKNISECEYDPQLALHLSFDFNVVPYNTCTIYQIHIKDGQDTIVKQIDEICLENPRNNTEDVCNEILNRYGKHKSGMFIYGDPTGKNRTTVSKKDNYDIILKTLYRYSDDYSMRVKRKALSLAKRRVFANRIFAGGFNISFLIDAKCKNSIADFEYVKEAPDGGKLKQKFNDKQKGISYEKYGHCFVAGTMVKTIDGDKPIEQINVGDFVLTRKGYKKVVKSGLTRKNAFVKTYEINGNKITCTPDHKIWTLKGFKEVDSLINSDTLNIFAVCKTKQNTKAGCSITTRKVKTHPIESILKVGFLSMVKELKRTYIDMFGTARMVKYLKNIIYTIKTAIRLIIILKTYNVSKHQNTTGYIGNKKQKNKKRKQKKFLFKKLYLKLKNGTLLKKVLNGIKNTQKKFILKTFVKLIVLNVVMRGKQETQELDFVLTNVKVDTTLESIEDVYDITVSEQHEFFANNILVHNCSDSFDYFVTSAFEHLI